MNKITAIIVKKFIKNSDSVFDPSVRSAYGKLEGWVGIAGNLVLFAVKFYVGIVSGSAALLADAVHTLGDSITSAVVIAGFIMAAKPGDREHPFGHERMESIAALVISILLFVTGFELVIYSIKKIMHPSISRVSFTIMAIIAVTILAKEIMSKFSYELGEMINSDALRADALHHRTDVAATAMVLLALIGARFNFFFLDGIMGAVVSFIIFYSAYYIFKNAVDILLGRAPSKKLLEKIREEVLKSPKIIGVHNIIIHQYGSRSVISLHAEIKENMTSDELHGISEDVENRIINTVPGAMATVHMEPLNPYHPEKKDVELLISEISSKDIRVQSFQNLRIIGKRKKFFSVLFDLVLLPGVEKNEKDKLLALFNERLLSKFPDIKIFIRIV